MRGFRALHPKFAEVGAAVAGVSLERADANRAVAERLALPYPLLSDPERAAGTAFRVLTRVGIGGWGIELFRRTTFLVDVRGAIAAVWGHVRVGGHALEVLRAARALAGLAAD